MQQKMTTATTLITDGQNKQIRRFIEDAFDRAIKDGLLDKERMQKLIENGNEFQAHIIAGIKELSIPNQFADEEVSSNYTYPPEYKGPRNIAEQVKTIAKIFNLDAKQALEYIKNLPALPDGAEGWFAIPAVDAIAKHHFPEVTDPAEKYCRAIQLVLKKIAESREFYNYREGNITPEHLRLTARTAHALELIAKTQKNSDILVVACQLGMRHRGRSTRRSREVFVVNEFGLGSLAGGSIVLTHPERLVRFDELDMDCPGDEFSPDGDGGLSRAPIFYFVDVKAKFGAIFVDIADGYYGSGSGFLSQVELANLES